MSTTKVVVTLPDDISYDVRIGAGQLDDVGKRLRTFSSAAQVLVVTDSNVAELYLASVRASLAAAGFRSYQITVPAGEGSKSIECATEIWQAMAALKLSREVLVVALGGGVVGDLAGFVASTYMRGVHVVQVPTTLLSMVDSSVGGKTGVNLDSGKNLVGTFKQPDYVCASTDTLATLPQREWACGCAEIAKSALIDSDDFFFWLVDNASALVARTQSVVQEAIARCVVFKANVVAADQWEEKGLRECLNYGHTFGHAIEAVAGFGTYSHGQGVAEGMRFAARLGVALVGTSADLVEEQDRLLDSLELFEIDFSAEPEAMLAAMMGDKKVREGHLRFVLPRDVGDWEIVEVDLDTVLAHLKAWQKSKA